MAKRNLKVGTIREVSGEVNIAAGDIIKNIKTIHQRALTAAEEASRARKLESKRLAQGITALVQSLSAQASEGTESGSPYKGLLPYGLNEAEIFYGRDKARRDLLDHIKQGPLTVLHAESGAGKSSLLQAGVAAQLIANGHLAVYLRPRDAEPVDFIKRIFLPDLTQAPALAKVSLREFLRQIGAVLGSKVTLYLLLDQFEEFFNLLDKDQHEPFLESLADCLNDPSLKVRWVIALRAEALSKLAELEAFGIAPFKNMYRLNRLSRAEAHEAIIEPAKRSDIHFEKALIDHILDSLITNGEVTPTQLQLVCSALTDDLPANQTLTLKYYIEHEGDTEGILRDYLKRQLEHLPAEEQAPAWKVLRALITADRLRDLKTYDELVEELTLSGVSKEEIDLVLARLVERRLLATQPATTETFELAHDYLVKEIELDPQEQARKAAQELLDDETRTYKRHKTLLSRERLAVIEPYRNELRLSADAEVLLSESRKAIQAERRARERRRNLTVGISLTVAIAMSILALWGFKSSRDANQQAEIANAGQLAAQIRSVQEQQYDLALLLSLEMQPDLVNTVKSGGNLIEVLEKLPKISKFLNGHTAPVVITSFSPNGELLASGDTDGKLILWDLTNAEVVPQLLLDDDNPINQLQFSPDNRTLISITYQGDAKVIIWDVNSGEQIRQLQFDGLYYESEFNKIALSPDGKTLAIVTDRTTITLWDIESDRPLREPVTLAAPEQWYGITGIVFTPDQQKVLLFINVNDQNLDGIIAWDIAREETLAAPLSDHYNIVFALALSQDGRYLASSSHDGMRVLWDVEKWERILELPRDYGYSFDIEDSGRGFAFSPDSAMLAWGNKDGTVALWDVDRGQIVDTLRGRNIDVTSLSFSPTGERLAAGGLDAKIILYDLVQESRVGNRYVLGDTATFSPDGKLLATLAYEDVYIYDTSTLEGVSILGKNIGLKGVGFDSKEPRVVSVSFYGEAIIWDLKSQEILTHYQGLDSQNELFSMNAEKSLVASTTGSTTIIVADLEKKVEIQNIKTEGIASLAFSPSGEVLAAGQTNGKILLWDTNTWEQVGELSSDQSIAVTQLAFSSDEKTLAASNEENTIVLWDVDNRNLIGEPLSTPSTTITTLAFSSDGSLLASGTREGQVILWDLKIFQELGILTTGYLDGVSSIAFSPTDKILVSSGDYFRGPSTIWNIDPNLWRNLACEIANRNLTSEEWKQYLPNEPYRQTCEQFPRELSYYRGLAETIFADDNESEQIQKASDRVRSEMELDSAIEDPILESARIVAEFAVAEITDRIDAENWEDALDLLNQAKSKDLPLDPILADGYSLYQLCWYGGIEGFADQVLEYCDRAIALAPDDLSLYDSRGIARALSGDYPGAIEDFEFFLENYEYESNVESHRQWIADLKAGKNPFTPEVLRQVKSIDEIYSEVAARQWESALDLLKQAEANKLPLGQILDDADYLNVICWDASLDGYAAQVLEYCERAVDLAPDDSAIRDSRGLARALTGDFVGAIEDFQFFVDQGIDQGWEESLVEQRQQWILDLDAGINPFTPALLNELR